MSVILTSTVISVLASVSVWIQGRRDPGGRPWLTGLCIGVMFLLPLLGLLPKWHLDWLGRTSGGSSAGEVMRWWEMLWLLGLLVMLLRLVCNQVVLGRWIGESSVLADRRLRGVFRDAVSDLGLDVVPGLRVRAGLASPVVAGLRKPVIVMPEHCVGWSDETFRMAVLHELGHLQRKDLWVRYLAEIVCAVYWYNPLVWWMRSTLLSQCEYACDARVIATGAEASVYARALCDVIEDAMDNTGVSTPFGVCTMADHAPLQDRVTRLMAGSRPAMPWLAIVAALVTTGAAFGLSLLRPAVADDAGWELESSGYSQGEIDLRHGANPFPGN